MRITYLRMENLKSILAGMGKNKVEIDFSKGQFRIVVFFIF